MMLGHGVPPGRSISALLGKGVEEGIRLTRLLLTAALVLVPAQMSHAATFTVTNTDGGAVAGSFITALSAANSNAGADTIEFDIPGAGPHVIDFTQTPAVYEAVTIDGTTQPGYIDTPVVKLSRSAFEVNFYVDAPEVEIRGLAFSNVRLLLLSADRAKIVGSSFGADVTDPEQSVGIEIRAANDVIIGGAGTEEGNQFGKVGRGVTLGNASAGTRINGNFFGVQAFTGGISAGVLVEPGTPGALIGTEAGNTFTNREYGVLLANSSLSVPATGITILNNSFYGNGEGILFADPAGNNGQQPPVITEAISSSTQTGVTFEYANVSGGDGDYLVQFFSNPLAERQGRTFLGETTITTSGFGVATYDATLPAAVTVGHYVNSTITRLSTGDTSEFSNDEAVVGSSTYSFQQSSVSIAEGGMATVIVERDDTTRSETIDYATAGGTATSGVDFTPTSGTLMFGIGTSQMSIDVPTTGDAVVEPDETFSVALSNPQPVANVPGAATVSILNDDAAGVTVTPTTGLVTSESGDSDTFTIVLTSQPTSGNDVTISLSTSEPGEGSVSPSSVVFDESNWATPQMVTVTGVDDAVDDGDQAYTIVTTAASGDPLYDGITVADPAVTNTDDDGAGVTVTPTTGLVTSESGDSDTFTIVLTSQPTTGNDVTISLSSSDSAEGSVSPSSVVFDGTNWATPQMVTVTGVDDAVDDGDQAYTIVTTATSGDFLYDGITVADPAVTNTDDDGAGVTVTPTTGLVTSETGDSDTFTIVLESAPIADVTITLSSDPAEGSVSPSVVTFTPADWATPQMVTVTGVDDNLADGDQPYSVAAAVASADPLYDGMVVAEVEVTNLDDETSAGDSDGDGVPNETEDAGPNGGDGNDDGIPDSTQPLVVTLPTANGNGWMTLTSTCEMREVEAIAASALPSAPRMFPYALVEFRIPCPAADLDILYHAGSGWGEDLGYWKYGPDEPGQALTTKWYELPGVTFDTTAVDGATVARARFSLVDGVLGDDTGVDGVIVDQGGPGTPLPAASIPTASEWMLIVMAMLLAVAGGLRLRV